MTATARHPMPWLIILAGSLIAVMTFGPRSAMGFFQLPMLADRGWDRSTFGLAMAFQNLFWGVSQPFFGALADKYGTGRVLVMSGRPGLIKKEIRVTIPRPRSADIVLEPEFIARASVNARRATGPRGPS